MPRYLLQGKPDAIHSPVMNGLFETTTFNWILVTLAAFFIGLSKAGIKGVDMMNITIMAVVFGGKASTGVVLPLLCVADIMAVWYYHRHAQWEHFWKLLPGMVVGILVGVFAGKDMDEVLFRRIMAFFILLAVIILLLLELRKKISVPHNKGFVALMGTVCGLTTMLGNLAGAFSTIYFLALRMNKNDFIGTAAWVFLVINLFKLPFQIIFWKNITPASLWMDLLLVPALIIGFFCGLRIVSKIKDDNYRKVVILLTLVGAVFILFR